MAPSLHSTEKQLEMEMKRNAMRGTVPASHALRAEGDAARRVRESQRGGEGARDEPADLGAVPRVRLAADVDGGAADDHREGEGEEEA